MDNELLKELKALRREVKGLRDDANNNAQRKRDAARYQRYRDLKKSGNLSLKHAIGRGMPTVPTYAEWDGMSSDEAKEQYDYYNSGSGRL